jgi:hypothetical protein
VRTIWMVAGSVKDKGATEKLQEVVGPPPERPREFAPDSPLEGGVYCELVSEVGFRRVANKARFQGVYG